MDQDQDLQVSQPLLPKASGGEPAELPGAAQLARDRARISRRKALKYGAAGLVCASGGGAALYYGTSAVSDAVNRVRAAAAAEVFSNDAPKGKLWQRWQQRGWVKEARHYLKLGENIQCKLCPNECLLQPEDRGRCRNRVHKDGKLYTLAYANPCSEQLDPIEKKPLFHFLPSTGVYSIATSGCGFRCLNCQNWEISQRKPEETKDPRGAPFRIAPRDVPVTAAADVARMSIFPEDVVAIAEFFGCPSIAYTYSEPTVWYEYMVDTAKAARQKNVKNVWVTCGYIQQEPLVEFCGVLDAANVDLKSFDEEIYKTLNTGKLEPILNTLTTLRREGVWFEVTNLVVPTYTDKPEMIRRMCDWLVANLGPDYPLHFSRFHAQHKLTHLPQTPIEMLRQARSIARDAGLHYVYVGNCPEIEDGETTFCPQCHKAVIERRHFGVRRLDLEDGKCIHCDTKIAGIWS